MTQHAIDDTDAVRPHIRLCHQILREGLAQGFRSIVFEAGAGAMPSARAQRDGRWQVLMAFPLPAFEALALHFRSMAGLGDAESVAGGTIHVTLAGTTAAIAIMVRRDEDGFDDVALLFPASRVLVSDREHR